MCAHLARLIQTTLLMRPPRIIREDAGGAHVGYSNTHGGGQMVHELRGLQGGGDGCNRHNMQVAASVAAQVHGAALPDANI